MRNLKVVNGRESGSGNQATDVQFAQRRCPARLWPGEHSLSLTPEEVVCSFKGYVVAQTGRDCRRGHFTQRGECGRVYTLPAQTLQEAPCGHTLRRKTRVFGTVTEHECGWQGSASPQASRRSSFSEFP